MRTIQLGIAMLALLAGLLVLWKFVGAGAPAESLAAAPIAPGDEAARAADLAEGTGPSRTAHAAEADREALEELAAAPSSPSAAGSPEESKPEVRGRVLRADGGPVAGASVLATTSLTRVELPLDIEAEGIPRTWHDIVSAETDASGVYRIEGLEPGGLRIAVRAHGFAPRDEAGWRVPEHEGVHELPDLVLASGASLAGRVVDSKGDGVAGAEILLAIEGAMSGARIVRTSRGVPLATSGPDGAFRIDQLAPGPWRLIVDSPGHLPATATGDTERGGPPLTIAVETGVEIRGRVRGRAGEVPPELLATLRIDARPVVEAPENDGFGMTASSSRPAEERFLDRARRSACDDAGAFAIAGLRPFIGYRLTAWVQSDVEPGGWKRTEDVASVVATAGERGIELEYRPRGKLVFQVVSDASGEPLSELGVWVGAGRRRVLADARGDPIRVHPEGRVTCPDLRMGQNGQPISLRIAAAGYEAHERDGIRVAPGETQDLGVVRLRPAQRLLVEVLDLDTGEPLRGARVAIASGAGDDLRGFVERMGPKQFFSDPDIRCALTDGDGRALLSSAFGATCTVIASAKGHVTSEPESVLTGTGPEHRHAIRLSRGGAVVARVTSAAGEPIEGARVQHKRPGETADADDFGPGEGAGDSTRADGTVRFEALEPGVHGFRVDESQGQFVWYEDDEEARPLEWRDVVVAVGATVELELVAPERTGLSGRVFESGSPLVGATLKLMPEREVEKGAVTWAGTRDPLAADSDHQGRFRFERIQAGRYTLHIGHPTRRMTAWFEVAIGAEPVVRDFDLPVTVLEGRAEDLEGRPLEGVEISVRPTAGDRGNPSPFRMVLDEDDRGSLRVRYDQEQQRPVRTDRDGRYALRGVLPDEPIVVAAGGELVREASTEPMTLGSGEIRRGVDFELGHAGAIALSLVGSSSGGGSWSWFEVQATRIDAEEEQVQRSTHLSTWQRKQVLGSLDPGRWRVALRRQEGGEPVEVQEVVVEEGRRCEVVFHL